MKTKDIDPIIEAALEEDMPQGDITSENILSSDMTSKAVIMSKEEGILAGIDVAKRVFENVDSTIFFKSLFKDGHAVKRGDKLAELSGKSISLLKGERTALNFLQRMSGIASTTFLFVQALKGSQTEVLDTRKTTPGLRVLEKYAVRMGGGRNHRFNLSEMVLIKDNHLQLVGSISEAVKRTRERVRSGIKIEVETTSLKEVKEALQCDADMVMLDNMSLDEMKQVVDWVKGRIPLEVSGNIDLNKAKEVASLGVDFISVGSLTHSYKSLDISMEFLAQKNAG